MSMIANPNQLLAAVKMYSTRADGLFWLIVEGQDFSARLSHKGQDYNTRRPEYTKEVLLAQCSLNVP
jgi:hypothetical protein